MATGNYGTIRPANVSPDDVDIFYTYSPSRDVPPQAPVRILDANNFLSQFNNPLSVNGNLPLLGGLYNLNLPADLFSDKGYYTIMIRPKQYNLNIFDCGVLSAYPDIKGLVFNTNDLPPTLSQNDSMVGYRIEYYDETSEIIPNIYRIVTSSNLTEAVSANIPNTTQKSTRYRFNDNSNLLFCTLTPTTPNSITPNKVPFIGSPGGTVLAASDMS